MSAVHLIVMFGEPGFDCCKKLCSCLICKKLLKAVIGISRWIPGITFHGATLFDLFYFPSSCIQLAGLSAATFSVLPY